MKTAGGVEMMRRLKFMPRGEIMNKDRRKARISIMPSGQYANITTFNEVKIFQICEGWRTLGGTAWIIGRQSLNIFVIVRIIMYGWRCVITKKIFIRALSLSLFGNWQSVFAVFSLIAYVASIALIFLSFFLSLCFFLIFKLVIENVNQELMSRPFFNRSIDRARLCCQSWSNFENKTFPPNLWICLLLEK